MLLELTEELTGQPLLYTFPTQKWASNKSNSSVTSSCACFLRSRLESQSWNSFCCNFHLLEASRLALRPSSIWPGDLRVVDFLPGFCFVLDLASIVEPRCLIMFAIYLPASLIVRTEPQSEIGRNRRKNT